MNQIESAALTLAGATLAFGVILFALWWLRRTHAAPAAPRAPRPPRDHRESRLPKLSRKTKAMVDHVEISPARLARISGKAPPACPSEPECKPAPPSAPISATSGIDQPIATAAIETSLEAVAATAERLAREPEYREEMQRSADTVVLRIVPQIPPRDAILTSSRLGGRPRLPRSMAWPEIKGEPADFLAQIDCASLPHDLWHGLGPREGSLAFFIDRQGHDVRVLHLREAGQPMTPPPALAGEGGCFAPEGGLAGSELAPFAVPAFPEWPVDLVAVRPGDPDPRDAGDPNEPGPGLYERGYDIADPAFHPFDWNSMTAMVGLLEMRLERLTTDAASFADANAKEAAAREQCVAINREAQIRAREIIAIVRDSAAREAFSPGDAMAVMAALHAIRWAKRIPVPDPETGALGSETIVLPLTTHRPDADLWVHDYQTLLFDRAKHAWCADPGSLSPSARAFYEPYWQALAAREMAAMGHEPFRPVDGYHEERDAVLLELPTSGLMSRKFGDGGNLVVTIDKADLAIADFSKLRVEISP